MNSPVHRTVGFALQSTATKVLVSVAAITAATVTPAAATTYFTCTTVAACALVTNNATAPTGEAIAGISRNGTAIQGTTYFTGDTSFATAAAGIAGFDLNPSFTPQFNSGVFGYSGTGSGVRGSSLYGSGVLGIGTSLYGVGVNAVSDYVALQASASSSSATSYGWGGPVGAFITSASPDGSDRGLIVGGTYGIFSDGVETGVEGTTSAKVFGAGVSGAALNGAGVGVDATSYGSKAIPLYVSTPTSVTLIDAESVVNGNYARALTLDHSGNLDVRGRVTGNASPMFETRRADGGRVMAYGPRATQATIEDVGEAQMIAGSAAVSLSADFAQTLDLKLPYHVFVTPEGENHGLYVTQKTPHGFVVHESGGFRSAMAFEYRIVGTPRDVIAARLPSETSLARKLSLPAYHDAGTEQRRANLRLRMQKEREKLLLASRRTH